MCLLYGVFKTLLCLKGDDVGGNETKVCLCLLYGFFKTLLYVKGDELAENGKNVIFAYVSALWIL